MANCKFCNKETEIKCVNCSQFACDDHHLACELSKMGSELCYQKIGKVIAWSCAGTICQDCQIEVLTYSCKNCGLQFCTSVSEKLKCPKCLSPFCPNCLDEHQKTCTEKYDRDAEFGRLEGKFQKEK